MRLLNFIGLCSLLLLSGCMHQAAKPEPTQASHEQQARLDAPQPIEQTNHIQPQLMFELMLAEMLVQKGDLEGAFGLIYSVAEKTESLALIERAFQLSMNTFKPDNIQKTAALWRKVEPTESTPWRVGYLIALRQGDLSSALSYWQDYRQRSELSLQEDLKNTAAQVVQSAGSETGLAFFAKLNELYPDQWAASYAYGYAAEQFGQIELATELLENTIKHSNVPSEVYFSLANLYVEHDLTERGLSRLKNYITQESADWSVQERYARLEVKAGLYSEAEDRYLRIVENNPQAFTSKLSLALLQLERGEIKLAKVLLEELRVQEGYQDVSHYYLGLIAQNLKQFDQAIAYLELVKHSNYQLDAQLLIAQIRFETQGVSEALAYLDRIDLTDDEAKVKVWRAKGIFYSQVSDFNKAAAFYRRAVELSGDDLQLYYSLAMALYESQSFAEYERVLKNVIELYPNEPEALNALGYFYVEQKRELDLAEQLLDRALQLSPNSFHIIDSRGWLAYQRGNYQLAEQYLEQAWQLQKDAEVLLHLIQVKWALKNYQTAEQLWQDFHQQFPHNKPLQQIMEKLKR